MTQPIRVLVTGSAGQIGYQLLFRLASGQVFGENQPIILHLLELDVAMKALEGVVMELDDCAFPLLKEIIYTSDLKTACNGVNWAFLVGSVPRKAGMERKDLLSINSGVFIDQGRALNLYAASDCRVLVVGNPCNTNCMVASATASDIPNDRFFAMTMLDQNRAVAQLAIKAGVHTSSVKNCIIFGNHSATQFPDYWHATIDGKPALDVIDDHAWFEETFIPTVQKRGAAIIQARGASSAASAANSAIDTVRKIVQPDGELFSVAVYSNGEYGSEAGTYVSMPCRVENGLVVVDTSWEHNNVAARHLSATFEELSSERQSVMSMGLINA